MLKSAIQKARGLVTTYSYNPKTNEFTEIEKVENLVMFSGADILARLATGDISYKLNTIYFEFDNATLTPPPDHDTDRTVVRNYYDLPAGTRDFLRTPISGVPTMTASSGDYAGNVLTFFGMTSGAGQLGGAGRANYTNGVSSVIGVGLLAAPVPLVQANDVLFARVYLDTPIQKEANKQVAITWQVTFI